MVDTPRDHDPAGATVPPPADHDTAGATPPSPMAGDVASLPSMAEVARTLVAPGGHATLCTALPDGGPYGSLVAYAADTDGSVLLCLSELAEHTHNARADGRASLLVTARDVPPADDPLAHPRVTLVGVLAPVEVAPALRDGYLALHPRAALYIEYGDFGWWRLAVERARCIGGFGAMDWIGRDAYAAAAPDPVAGHAERVIAHMNGDHADACLLYARHLAGVADALHAAVVGVDRYGMTLHVDTPAAKRAARVAFDAPVDSAAGVRAAAVALVARARRMAATA